MDYYKPILTLLLSITLFHIFLIWLFPQSKKFWKQTRLSMDFTWNNWNNWFNILFKTRVFQR